MTAGDLPESFFCPITHDIMKDPVSDPDGVSYERTAILDYIEHHGTSPKTSKPLKATDLVSNNALLKALQALSISAAPEPASVETVDLTVAARVDPDGGPADVLIKIEPSAGVERTPVDVCCVIDVSGSMDTTATLKNQAGDIESHGLNILDVVKHAVRTVIQSLGPRDRLALVSFSDTANTELSLTEMTEDGQRRATAAVEALRPTSSTNLWDGLRLGMDVLRNAGVEGRVSTVFLLTDGLPNVSPPRGHMAMLQQYKDKHGLPGIINTFGFGYSLDSELLNDLAVQGNGSYAFIPESSFVGTVFVHATANLMTIMGKNAKLSLEPQNGATIQTILGSHTHQSASWGISVDIGSIQYGQSKDFVLKMHGIPADGLPCLTATLTYDPWHSGHRTLSTTGTQTSGHPTLQHHIHRLTFVDTIASNLNLY
ncbi:hypothetical protein HK104_003181, partial [Borealophlyctis nickersoniae]